MEISVKDKIKKLINESGQLARDYVFSSQVPIKPNGLILSKWVEKELIEIDYVIDALERKHGVDV